MSDSDGFIPGFIIASIMCLALFSLWIMPGIDASWKDQIQAHGCGGYYLDANSVRQWNWKEPKP